MDSNSTIKTARRVFEVFEYFDECQRPLSLKEISDHFSYPVSSASVLMKSLLALGYLDYERTSRTYMPTVRCSALGSWVPDALFADSKVLDLMRTLSERTSEMVSIATQSDVFAQYLYVVPSSSGPKTNLKPGTVRPLARSGLGWLLLSARSDEAIDQTLRRINYSESHANKVGLDDLMKKVQIIRRQGYVFSKHTVRKEHGVIGMMLPVRQCGRTIVIGVGGTVRNLESKQHKIIDELKRCVELAAPNVPDRRTFHESKLVPVL